MAELRLYTEPTTKTIKVQESFKASIVLEDCLGSLKLSEHVTWLSGNPDIVEVEHETGIVTAISTGETYVIPVGKVYGNLKAIQVIVNE